MNSCPTVYARRQVVANRHTPVAQVAIVVTIMVSLTLSSCVGLTSAGATGEKRSNSSASRTLAVSATSFSFGNVATGSKSLQTLTLTNTGTATVVISQATVFGAGFSVAGGMSSISIAAGQNQAFQIQFAPQAAGSANGSLIVASNASDSTLTISLSGNGTPGLSIMTQPAGESVTLGQTATFDVTAIGSGTLTFQWKKYGTVIGGATSSTYTTPVTTASDNGALFTVLVSNSTGNITSNAATLTVNAATSLLNASTTSLSFASVNIGSNSALGVTFSNSGNSNVTVSSVNISGAGFSASGVSTGQILTPGQTATLNVTFTPSTATGLTGIVTVTSNATNSPATVSLSGTGVQPVSHSVTSSWTASTSTVAGYNVYRSAVSGGPYAKVNSSVVTTTQDVDSSVQSGHTYFYVVTSVDSNNVESIFSNEVSAAIP